MDTQFTKRKILIIDPEPADRSLVKTSLDNRIYDFLEADNLKAGFYQALGYNPDLIITEILPPLEGSFDFIQRIKSETPIAHTPVFFLTAIRDKKYQLKGLKSGAEAYVKKPFNHEELRIRIANTIESRSLVKQHHERKKIVSQLNQTLDDHSFWVEFTSYIYSQIENPSLNSTLICKQLGISERQLRRKIRPFTHKSLANYILSIRLDYAKKVLNRQQVSIAEVAYMTGFSSPSNFTRAFKKNYGIPPSQFKLSYSLQYD